MALHVGVDEPETVTAPPQPPARRLLGAGLVVLALVAGAGLVAEPGVTGDPDVLGRLDEHSGRSSLLPPVDDLQLLWQRSVDASSTVTAGPTRLQALPAGAVVGGVVVGASPTGGEVVLPEGAVADDDGAVLVVEDGSVVVLDAVTGDVRSRADLAGSAWQPTGPSLGWVAGAAVLTDADGTVGAVAPDGSVRWVGDTTWAWDGVGHGTDWLVVTQRATVDRVLVVDGTTGEVHRDVGPVGTVHAPVVVADTLAWVDPFGGVDRGLGAPVELHGLLLDGSGRSWVADDLPPTSGVPTGVRLTAVEDGVAVAYWTAGQATTATWFDPAGRWLGTVSVVGTGRTEEGWPVAAVVGDAVAHVDPVRREIRVVDRRGSVRWALPARAGEGLTTAAGMVLVRTPPTGTSLQHRERLLDAGNGAVLWDRISDDTEQQRLVAVLDGHVGLRAGSASATVAEDTWFDLETGRRRSGPGIAARLLDRDRVPADLVLLGRVAVGATVRPVFTTTDGSVLGLAGAGPERDLASLLAAAEGVDPGEATVADPTLAVTVTTGGVAASVDRGDGWTVATTTGLQPALTVLLDEVVVVTTWTGDLVALDRTDGAQRWRLGGRTVTALTAGGDEVVAGTAAGRVLVVAGADGTIEQDVLAARARVEDIAVVDGRVVATLGGDVVALGRGAAVVEVDDRVEIP